MVKVVGEAPVETKQVTCPNCGYMLEFTGIDITKHTDYEGDTVQIITCPLDRCHASVRVRWP